VDGKAGVGVTHRDIKPANLLLVGGSVKVGDFGLAKLLEHTATKNTGNAMTVAYAPPEFLQGHVHRNSDQYSLAVTYCELRCGRLPFQGDAVQLMFAHLQQPPNLTMLPEGERPVVARALAKPPEERWPSCRAFVEALTAVIDRGGPRAFAPGSPAPRDTAPPRPGKVVAGPGRAPPAVAPKRHPPVTPTVLETRPPGRTPWLAGTAVMLVLACIPLGLLFFGGTADPETPAKPALSAPDKVAPVVAKGAALKQAEATPKQESPKFLKNSIGLELVLIPKGTFLMGSKAMEAGHFDNEDEHEVEITQPFYLGKYEVTKGEFAEFVRATGHQTDAEKDGGGATTPTPSSWNSARSTPGGTPVGSKRIGIRWST
jgi:hypothetical protein